ncbi:MAG: YafY family protein [Candidatus Limiplasma sp.]|nr:YafY family protein [Candidatus Limiplasma sp.]
MKVDRLVSIIMLLLNRDRIGAQELAAQFEVSTRTIYRDIESINMAGIPVCATVGVGGGFEILRQYKVDRQVFSTADLSAILMGLTSLSDVIRGDELVNALAKVKSFIPAEREKDIALKTNQITIDLTPWLGNRTLQPNLKIIQTALQESKLLTFAYVNHSGTKTQRTAEPYQLVLKGGQWYWQGFCYSRNDYRLFKLSRTSELRMQQAGFTPREPQKPLLDFSDQLAAMQTEIKLRIHRSILERILDYCPPEQCVTDGEAHFLVRFPFIANDYFYNFLLGFGDRCECLEPLPIRAEIRRRIQAMAALYEHDS